MSRAQWQGRPDAIVGQYGVDFPAHSSDQGPGKGRAVLRFALSTSCGEGEPAGAVKGDMQMQLALCAVKFGQIKVEKAYWIGLELLSGGVIAFDIRLSTDAVSLQAPMQ